MPIEKVNGATIATGDAVKLFSLLSLKGRLKLEMVGIKFRGGSTFAYVKRTFGFKGNKAAVLAQLEKYIEENGARLAQSGGE